jgi:hypothetical protein
LKTSVAGTAWRKIHTPAAKWSASSAGTHHLRGAPAASAATAAAAAARRIFNGSCEPATVDAHRLQREERDLPERERREQRHQRALAQLVGHARVQHDRQRAAERHDHERHRRRVIGAVADLQREPHGRRRRGEQPRLGDGELRALGRHRRYYATPAPCNIEWPLRLPSHLRPALLLAFAVVAVYALSLRGGFLNYDDDWLIRDNPVFGRPGGLRAIWTDVGSETRHQLGAEYLPVRDTLMWLQVRLFGPSPRALRAVSLALYLAAVLLLRAYLRRALDPRLGEIAAWLFALHPVHVESVAWLAGQKDLAALVAVAAALFCYGRGRRAAVPILTLAAVLSKSVAVVLPLLLLLDDFLARRRPDWLVLSLSTAVVAAALAVHLHVGRVVAMLAPQPGGSRLATAATMGPVWLTYLARSFVPVGLSVQHEVTMRSAGNLLGWLAYVPLVALAGAACGPRSAASVSGPGRSRGSSCRSCPRATCSRRCRT